MQPAYSAVILSKFVRRFTKFAVVLTAGPLKNTGILDLVCVPDGYLIFGGSWGQEWVLMGDHIVNDKQFSDENKAALSELANRIDRLLKKLEFCQFRMVGSGFQRKVDRVTIGHQNVSQDINEATQKELLSEIYNILHEVDPKHSILTVHESDLDIEIILRTGDAKAFNKADGIRLIMEQDRRNIHEGNILVCGDTASDLPMVEYTIKENPNTFAIFVNPRDDVRARLEELLDADHRICVGCPEVIHVAMAEVVFNDILE